MDGLGLCETCKATTDTAVAMAKCKLNMIMDRENMIIT